MGLTKAGYDELKGKLNFGAGCLGFTLGELDSKVDRAPLADAALNGNSFGVSYGGPYGLAVGADISVAAKGQSQFNPGIGFSTPGVTYFDFSHSKLIGNTKDTEPYAKGLMHAFGGL